MRILHTSDWHLGRAFHRVDLLADQAAQLEHLADVVRQESVDVLVVAGDVYDRALPSPDTVAMLDEALDRILDAGAQIVLTSGNHDSAVRLGFGARRNARAGLHLRTSAECLDRPVMLPDDDGPVAFYGIPYLEPALVCESLGAARSHHAVLSAAMGRINAARRTHPTGRTVLAAHAFVTGAATSDSERDIRVGGVDSVSGSVFDGVDYVALGHLHGRQQLTDTVRYSGSPLPYSFSEATHQKGSWLIDLGAQRVSDVIAVESAPYRRLAVLRGRLPDLLADARHHAAENAFCQVVLTDPDRPRQAMEQLRRRFPFAVALSFEPDGVPHPRTAPVMDGSVPDEDLCCSFLREVRQHDETPAERAWLGRALEHARVRAVAQ